MLIEFSDELVVSTFRTQVECCDPEDGGSKLPRYAGKRLQINKTYVTKYMNRHKYRSHEEKFSKNI
jgi:hypothetical protein